MSAFNLVQPINAPREIVWQALSRPGGLTAWQADEVEGTVQEGARLILRYPALGAEAEVQVTELHDGERIALSWGAHRVSFCIEAGGVSLQCSGISDPDELRGTGSAWTLSLATLAHYCEHHHGASRSVCWLTGKTKASPDVLHAYLTEPWAHESWLGSGSGIGALGSDVRIQLSEELSLSGKVLAHTPGRDVLISWTEDDDSVVAFRSLPSPVSDERIVAMLWSRWSPRAPKPGALSCLRTAHSRLLTVLGRAGEA
jgi:uncharacterized protein YndB with AHSA1/START domain